MANIHRHRVGSAEIISLQDSWARIPATGFFPDVPASSWDAYEEFRDEDGNITLNFGAWAVVSEGKRIVVDTGLGGRPTQLPTQTPVSFPQALEQAGFDPADVDLVVFSHLHFDHTGWNTVDVDGKPVPLFPKARHVVQQREWEYWTSTEELRKGAQFDNALGPIEFAGLLDLVEGEHALTSEMVTVPTPGHTPGHVSFVVASAGERAYIIGDAAHQPVQVTEDSWCPGADVDPADSTRSRAALFERIEQEGATIASGHFPFPGLGKAIRAGGRRRYQPQA